MGNNDMLDALTYGILIDGKLIPVGFQQETTVQQPDYSEEVYVLSVVSYDRKGWESFVEQFIYTELAHDFHDEIFEIRVTSVDNAGNSGYDQEIHVQVIGSVALHETVKCALIALNKCDELDFQEIDTY